MDKIAQRRKFLDKFRETINMPGKYLDGVFKPEIERIMVALKEMDDRIRAVFTGKTIGTAMPVDNAAIKDILKNARRNFNRREYMSSIIDLGHFHKKMLEVAKDVAAFKVDVDKIHHKFLFEGLKDTGYDTKLDSFRQHMKDLQTKADYSTDHFIKEAGMIDDIVSFFSRRGRGLLAWEKRYPQKVKALRDGNEALLNESQGIFDRCIANLKLMATARATRRPDEYIEHANKIKSDFDRFDLKFRDFYSKAVQPWLDIKDQVEAKEKAEAEKAGVGSPIPPAPSAPPSAVQPTGPNVISTPPVPLAPPAGVPSGVMSSPPTAPPPSLPLETIEEGPPTERSPAPLHTAHQNFYNSLEALSKESPQIVAKYIAKYASSIQESDPETAIKLFKVIQRIKG